MACILITIDCGRADHLLGDGVPTPSLDAFREEAVTYSRCYSHTNITLPSHRTMLTGLWPSRHGVISNFVDVPLPDESLPSQLASRGVPCDAFLSTNFLELLLGQRIGDTMDPFFKSLDGSEPFLTAKIHGVKVRMGRRDVRREAGKTLNLALKWLGRIDPEREPFSLIHLFDAHTPYAAPDSLIEEELSRAAVKVESDSSLKEQLDERELFCAHPQLRLKEKISIDYHPAVYRAALRHIDAELGRFFERLKETGHWDRSTIAITADHGENLGEHGVYCGHQLLFDETIHVPLIVKYPGGKSASTTVDFAVGHADMAQSLAAHYDLTLPGDGKPLAELERGRDQFSEHAKHFQASLRRGSACYIRSWRPPPSDGSLRSKLFEQTGWTGKKGPKDLPPSLDAIVEELEKSEIAAEGVDREVEAQLRGLGYM